MGYTHLIHADQNISRCPSCGGWQWLDWCNTCEQPTIEEAS